VTGPLLTAVEADQYFLLWRNWVASGSSLNLSRFPTCSSSTSHLGRRGEEELAPEVDVVHAPVGKRLVEVGLNADGVLGEEHRVDVERERD
jgi:hypothetical protein